MLGSFFVYLFIAMLLLSWLDYVVSLLLFALPLSYAFLFINVCMAMHLLIWKDCGHLLLPVLRGVWAPLVSIFSINHDFDKRDVVRFSLKPSRRWNALPPELRRKTSALLKNFWCHTSLSWPFPNLSCLTTLIPCRFVVKNFIQYNT